MADISGRLFIGTAGWSYPDWQGVVYRTIKPSERLQAVARYLDCVEINSSFYRPPSPRTAETWLRTVTGQDHFCFLAKAWQRFTHERTTPWTPAEVRLFTDGLQPLRAAGRLDALLFQFPWSFRREPANLGWIDRIAESFTGWPVAIEVRHDSWAGTEELFRARNFTYCNIDQPQLNHCLPPAALATTDTGYFRLHGRNAGNWFKAKEEVYGDRYDHLYTTSELTEVLQPIRVLSKKTKKTFVIFNNHKDGKAFANALQLKARLVAPQLVRSPVALLNRFPELSRIAHGDEDEQLPLV